MTRKDEFLDKFKALLREYNAEISIETVTRGYSEDHSIIIYAYPVFEDGELVADSIEINLGTWEGGND